LLNCLWALNVKMPLRVSASGGRYHYQDDWEFYDTLVTSFEYDGKLITWEGKSCNNKSYYGRGRGATIHGTKGTMLIDRDGYELYNNNDLDRGHLVRRRDPVWGDTAEKANKNTFHFTNCAPQHSNLNQKIWLDLENYILHNAESWNLKVTVFTGPVFRVDDIVYRGVQIPAEFWKIAIMVKENGNLSATAYLQTQKNLIEDLEFAYGEYKTYQVPISRIEEITGLNFGCLRNHDPITPLKSHVIEAPGDIKL